jgi:hypothetical protein
VVKLCYVILEVILTGTFQIVNNTFSLLLFYYFIGALIMTEKQKKENKVDVLCDSNNEESMVTEDVFLQEQLDATGKNPVCERTEAIEEKQEEEVPIVDDELSSVEHPNYQKRWTNIILHILGYSLLIAIIINLCLKINELQSSLNSSDYWVDYYTNRVNDLYDKISDLRDQIEYLEEQLP